MLIYFPAGVKKLVRRINVGETVKRSVKASNSKRMAKKLAGKGYNLALIGEIGGCFAGA